jgi:hypothetical protein
MKTKLLRTAKTSDSTEWRRAHVALVIRAPLWIELETKIYIYIYIYIYTHTHTHTYIYIYIYIYMGYAVAQLVEALRYKPEGRGFDSR